MTDGVQTRKLQANYGKFSYQELEKKLSSLFPETMKEDANMILRYYVQSCWSSVCLPGGFMLLCHQTFPIDKTIHINMQFE